MRSVFCVCSHELQQRQHLLDRHLLEEQIRILQTEVENSSQIISELSGRNETLSALVQQKEQDILTLKKAYSSNVQTPFLDPR